MDVDKLKLKKILRELESVRGRHTELVTYYIPAGSDFNKASEFIGQEIALTRNVKNKTVRKNVLGALEKITQELKLYKSLPENGFAIFCGNVSKDEGKTDIRLYIITPPDKVGIKLYRCDQKFETEPLKEFMKEKASYGVICLDKSSADIAVIYGKRVTILKHMTSLVPGKTRAGGQSSVRYSRVRENLLISFLQKIAATARELLEKEDIKGIILSGPGPIKEKFQKESYLLKSLADKVIGIVDTSDTDKPGIRETLERGRDLIKETEFVKEQDLLKDFFVKLSQGKGEVVYGAVDTFSIINENKAEIVLVSEEFDDMDKIEDLCEQMGIQMEIISMSSQEGVEFKNLGGIGAILRYV
ncbi:MAG: peptide chain release factor aRF-1 [Candidatus Aenigmarchaeota archaeon]|nr:peptide chain release factor aRF-1 [Candidatus Aenigmarchaeota archaeon]